MTKSENLLILASSETDANLYYATRFLAPDDFAFFQIRGVRHLLMSDLEVDRAKKQSSVDKIHSLSALAKAYEAKHGKRGRYLDLIVEFAKNQRAHHFFVPANFPLGMAEKLRELGLKLEVRPDPFLPKRVVKSPEEIRAITHAIRMTEAAVTQAIHAIRKSSVKKGKLYFQGELLTSERLKQIINVDLMKNGLIAAHSIVACGVQGVDPHCEGSGPIYANQSIIMDIFPRDSESRYFADLTRTVVKGKASAKLRAMFQAVKDGQDFGFKKIRPGIDASTVHLGIAKMFEERGFKTGILNGRMQGFFHSTGHGLGLDIHELPRISAMKEILKPGHVVTVEPGLYYEDAGGIRLEDVVVVTKTGCKNLTIIPKILEV